MGSARALPRVLGGFELTVVSAVSAKVHFAQTCPIGKIYERKDYRGLGYTCTQHEHGLGPDGTSDAHTIEGS